MRVEEEAEEAEEWKRSKKIRIKNWDRGRKGVGRLERRSARDGDDNKKKMITM